jgi:hypothetical protein
MAPEVQTARSASDQDATPSRVVDWVFLKADRRLIGAGIVAVLVGAFGALLAVGVLTVGTGSAVATVFGAGLTSGVVTLVTIALSINQLILSRLFGSPGTLLERLDGSREFRGRVEHLADVSSSPNEPAMFLSLLAVTLHERATTAVRLVDEADQELPDSVRDTLEDIAAYGRSIDDGVERETKVANVLGVIVGPEYALNTRAVHDLRERHGDSLPVDVQGELEAVEELLECVSVVRQFFKTIALQQDFATLSRLLVYSGLLALFTSVSLALVYRTNSITLSTPVLQVVVPLAFGVVIMPFALFGAYILRAATIAYRTVSVGPFVPPEDH